MNQQLLIWRQLGIHSLFLYIICKQYSYNKHYINRATFERLTEDHKLPYLDSDDEIEEEELVNATFNRDGTVSSYIHESVRAIGYSAIASATNHKIIDILLWIEPEPQDEWVLNDNRGRLDLLPNPKYFEMSAFLKRKGKRKKNKRKRKRNRKMKKLRICPICNISNEEYKFYKCKGCRKATYCSRSCQKKHWKRFHKLNCLNC